VWLHSKRQMFPLGRMTEKAISLWCVCTSENLYREKYQVSATRATFVQI
jgi:hypothetical protein